MIQNKGTSDGKEYYKNSKSNALEAEWALICVKQCLSEGTLARRQGSAKPGRSRAPASCLLVLVQKQGVGISDGIQCQIWAKVNM